MAPLVWLVGTAILLWFPQGVGRLRRAIDWRRLGRWRRL